MKKTLAATLLVLSSAAHAEFYSGNDLLNFLQSSGYSERALALGYIGGVADTLTGATVCMPKQVTLGQINDLVKGFLENSPQHRHNSADVIVATVLKTAWPCQRQQRETY